MAKYIEIAESIREKIKSGEYEKGEKLPYEYSLCMTYHCNKETMKKALNILVAEGLIIRRRGAGTFVKEFDADSSTAMNKTRSLTALVEGKKKLTSQVTEFRVIPCDEFIAKKLQIEVGDFVYHIIRNRSVDDYPFVIDITYIPLNIMPKLKVDVLRHSLYEYVTEVEGHKIQSCHINITASKATPNEVRFFRMNELDVCVQEEQISYLDNGHIFEYTIARYDYARYEFSTIMISQ
ncbi:MAG: GntR family transcriptional regulator [Erysipelotrichaceae bacterium]|nr:GntR family transcriptional regulator [Erysipelotrichaceae bacterium]